MAKVLSTYYNRAKNTRLGRYAQGAVRDIYGTYSGLAKNTIKGVKVGNRAAKIKKNNVATSAYKMLRGVIRCNTFATKDIPPILGGIGIVGFPFPMSGTFFYTLGLALKKGINVLKK